MNIGPVEQSQRDSALAARRRLMGTQIKAPVALEQPVPVKRMPEPRKVAPTAFRSIVDMVDYVIEMPSPTRWKVIVKEVCEQHGVTFSQVIGRQRSRPLVAARFEAYFRLSEETGFSLPQIGKLMGGKDHTSVLHGIRMHKQRCVDVTQQSELSTDEIRG